MQGIEKLAEFLRGYPEIQTASQMIKFLKKMKKDLDAEKIEDDEDDDVAWRAIAKLEAELKALRKELKAKPSGDSAGSTRVAGQNEADLQRLDEGEEEEEEGADASG